MDKMIKWRNPARTLGRSTLAVLDPQEMLQDFLEHGLITEITGNYSQDVYDMCRNGATWLGCRMAHFVDPSVQIVEGLFEGSSHCWVVLRAMYFDMTIAQSLPTAPAFAIVLAKDAHGYEEFMRFSVKDWIKANCKEIEV